LQHKRIRGGNKQRNLQLISPSLRGNRDDNSGGPVAHHSGKWDQLSAIMARSSGGVR
ncbi:hypothetical protein NHX12_031597, partial [Muraenolepis orangiensis]